MASFITNDQHTLELRDEPVTFGASADASVPVRPEFELSPLHFSVSPIGTGHFLRDCDSSTGTYVNGGRVEGAVLKDGDMVLAGKLEMTYMHPPAEYLTEALPSSGSFAWGDFLSGPGNGRKIAIVVAACIVFAFVARQFLSVSTEGESGRVEPSGGLYDGGDPALVGEAKPQAPKGPTGPTVIEMNRAVPGSGAETLPEAPQSTSEPER